jgi:hypothetical protein
MPDTGSYQGLRAPASHAPNAKNNNPRAAQRVHRLLSGKKGEPLKDRIDRHRKTVYHNGQIVVSGQQFSV